MTDYLFPCRAQIGSDDGLDADHWHYRQRGAIKPDRLTVTEDAEIGKLYGPDGRRYRTVREERPRVPFGFQPSERRQS